MFHGFAGLTAPERSPGLRFPSSLPEMPAGSGPVREDRPVFQRFPAGPVSADSYSSLALAYRFWKASVDSGA